MAVDVDWNCESCTLLNNCFLPYCEACGAPKEKKDSVANLLKISSLPPPSTISLLIPDASDESISSDRRNSTATMANTGQKPPNSDAFKQYDGSFTALGEQTMPELSSVQSVDPLNLHMMLQGDLENV